MFGHFELDLLEFVCYLDFINWFLCVRVIRSGFLPINNFGKIEFPMHQVRVNMGKKDDNREKASALRKRAEKKLELEEIPLDNLTEEEVRRLAHEFQVHQIELEMQNEELYRTQKIIEESKKKYSDLYDNAPVGYFTISEEDVILGVNLTAAMMLGIKRSLLIKKQLPLFISKKDRDKYYLCRRHVFTKRKQKVCGLEMEKRDGTSFNVQLSCVPHYDSDKNVKQCRIIMTDITGLKRIEKGMGKSEEKYRNLIETAQDAIVCDIDQSITEWNRAAERIFGYSKREIIGQPITTLIPEKHRKEHDEGVKRFLKTGKSKIIGKTVEVSGITKEGIEIPLEISITYQKLEDEQYLFTAIIRDITERKQFEKEIEGLAKFPEEDPNPVMRICKDGKILYNNRASMALLDSWGSQTTRRLPDNYRKIVSDALHSGLRNVVEVEYGTCVLALTFAPIIEKCYVNMYGLDITEFKQVGKELQQSEEKYRTLVEAMPEIVYKINENGYFTFLNSSIRSLGYEPNELIGKHFSTILHPDDANNFSRSIVLEKYSVMKTKESETPKLFDERRSEGRMTRNLEVRLISKNHGRVKSDKKEKKGLVTSFGEIVASGHYSDITDNHSRSFRGTVGIIIDITEKTKLQAEMIRTGQLALIGELAAGVAHEINNPIYAIINFAQLIGDESDKGSRQHEFSALILKEGNRISDLTKNLLTLSRSTGGPREPVNIHGLINDSLKLTDIQLKKDHIIVKDNIQNDIPPLMVNPQEIYQVFLNLIQNARYALNEKYPGKERDKILEISCKKIFSGDHRYVRIIFTDHGIGIPEETLHRVKNLFFTTKPSSKGTGIGLSVSENIIHNHDGKITIESIPGEFTKVLIDLPVPGSRRER